MKPLRILMVEDNAGDVRLLREMFSTERANSYELTHMARLGLALNHLAKGGVDIVLLDLGLPDGQGLETVRRVRQLAPDVPLIVLTGNDDDELVAAAMREGAQDYLVKGQIENRALPRALRHAIERFGLLSKAAATNRELERQVREKDILLREVHHRVKNSLQVVSSLVGMEAGRVTDPAITSRLRATQDRIRSMAAIHQTLYGSSDLAHVDFADFLHSFVPRVIESHNFGESQISLELEVSVGAVPIDAAVPCGLIVNELVSNALKHAFPDGRKGRIRIRFAQEANGLAELSVQDDGVGFAQGKLQEGSKTLGVRLISLLSKQLDGSLTCICEPNTAFIVRFPLAG